MSTPASILVKFWNDEVTDIHPSRLRKDIPPLPKISKEYQVVTGKFETLCYLALQILKSESKSVIIRCLASAPAILFEDPKNYTGAPNPPVALTGLDPVVDEAVTDRDAELTTNFENAEPVTIAEMDEMLEIDPDELGSFFGVMFLAGNKALSKENHAAFNEKRQSAVSATIIGEPKIFKTDSKFLSDIVLRKVYASFNSFLPIRSNVVSNVVNRLSHVNVGPTLAFATMFLLLVDSGMSALRIIKEAVVKHKWIVTEFPELKPEIEAAQAGLLSVAKGAPHERSFLKAIHGSSYVPVAYSSVTNLTGVCKFILKETTVSYAQYDGGKVTDSQEAKLTRLMIEKGLMRAPADAAVVQE